MFVKHLRQTHNPTQELVDQKIKSCRMGYWCGFCQVIVKLANLEERFDHIDGHFMGRKGFEKTSIEMWMRKNDNTR